MFEMLQKVRYILVAVQVLGGEENRYNLVTAKVFSAGGNSILFGNSQNFSVLQKI
jgi:hypothetical protein